MPERRKMIQDFLNLHKGEIAVIVGNGTSLDETPLESLARKYKTFGANKIYDSLSHPNFVPTYWTCIDQDMLHDTIPYVLTHPEFNSIKFVPRNIPLSGANLLNLQIDGIFSTDASEIVFMGGTVTFVNLQLAYYMGFETVLLVGVDHRYPRRGIDGIQGSKFIADETDLAHFKGKHGPYFTPGNIYNRPELEMTAKYTYPKALAAFMSAKRKIFNLTPNTALDVFPKEGWDKWLK
jgi:hypothetical protein